MYLTRFCLTALMVLSLGWPAIPAQAAPSPTELQGKVAAQVDPFLLLRNLARLSPETFNQLLEQALAGLELPDVVKNPLQNLINNAKDPEDIIDFIENADKTLLNNAIRQAISQFLVFNRDQVLALIPNLPQEIKDVLALLLPETIDLNQLPLAMSSITVMNKSGWPLWFGITNKDGDYKIKLPAGAVSLRVGHIGYREVTIPLEQALAGAGKIWLIPSAGRLEGTVFTGSGFRRKAIQNARITVLTAADVVTTTAAGSQKPTAMSNRWGLFAFDNVSPLLPGLLGGIGVQRIEVDADNYYLEKKNAIFLAGSSRTPVEVREAPPVGRLEGLVRYASALGARKRDDANIEVLNDQDEIIASGKSLAGTGILDPVRGTYAIPPNWQEDYLPQDLYIPKGTYKVRFSYPDYPTVINSNVVIKSARATTSDACLNGSLRGTVTDPLKSGLLALRTGVNVRVVDGSNTTVAEATTVAGVYLINVIPGGTYRIEFRNNSASTNPDEVVENFEIPVCESKTLDKGVYDICYYESWGTLGGLVKGKACETCPRFLLTNATVKVLTGSTVIAQGNTSIGIYGLQKVQSGTYTVEFSKSGYPTQTELNYTINKCGIQVLDKNLN